MSLKNTYSRSTNIFITGGIGDFFLLEAFFSDEMRNNLKIINFATRACESIINVINTLPDKVYPKINELNIIYNDFSNFWCFFSKPDFTKRIPDLSYRIDNSVDWSIATIFPYIRHKILKYNNSSFVLHNIADINRFKLPKNYISIVPYSGDKRNKNRDFNNKDWRNVIKKLEEKDIKGVVLDVGNNPIPESENLINLQNKTTLSESIEIIKSSFGYIGIDSCLSVIASFVHVDSILIKSVNQHLYNCKDIYYCTKNNFDFIVGEIL